MKTVEEIDRQLNAMREQWLKSKEGEKEIMDKIDSLLDKRNELTKIKA